MEFQSGFSLVLFLPVNQITIPNIITVARIIACPIIFFLAVSPELGARFWAFALFVVAGLSDVWDGYLARRYNMITDTGKLLDGIAAIVNDGVVSRYYARSVLTPRVVGLETMVHF